MAATDSRSADPQDIAMTPEEMTNRSSKLLEQFDGLETGSVISILATALQMAVCYGAKTKEDAMHMISCLMVDAEHDMPRQYDLVQGMREMVSKVMPGRRGNGQ